MAPQARPPPICLRRRPSAEELRPAVAVRLLPPVPCCGSLLSLQKATNPQSLKDKRFRVVLAARLLRVSMQKGVPGLQPTSASKHREIQRPAPQSNPRPQAPEQEELGQDDRRGCQERERARQRRRDATVRERAAHSLQASGGRREAGRSSSGTEEGMPCCSAGNKTSSVQPMLRIPPGRPFSTARLPVPGKANHGLRPPIPRLDGAQRVVSATTRDKRCSRCEKNLPAHDKSRRKQTIQSGLRGQQYGVILPGPEFRTSHGWTPRAPSTAAS